MARKHLSLEEDVLLKIKVSRIYTVSECSQNNSTTHFTVTGADLVMNSHLLCMKL
jgi:hypothetical protein